MSVEFPGKSVVAPPKSSFTMSVLGGGAPAYAWSGGQSPALNLIPQEAFTFFLYFFEAWILSSVFGTHQFIVSSRDPHVSISPGPQAHAQGLTFFSYLGIEFRSSRSHGKHFTTRAVLQAPRKQPLHDFINMMNKSKSLLQSLTQPSNTSRLS